MEYTCSYCGVVLRAPAPGAPLVCQNCGASQPARTGGAPAPAAGTWLAISDLAKLSLGQTPEAMAKLTGAPAKPRLGSLGMKVALSGGAWDTMVVMWDPADPSHARRVQVYASDPPADDAAIRERLGKMLGRRLGKDGSFLAPWSGVSVGYDGSSAGAGYDAPREGFPRWKEALDAAWEVLRGAVLGLDVTVPDAALRDWFRGYPLADLAAIDPGLPADRAAATLEPLFPGASPATALGFELSMALDHPVFGQIKLSWGRGKGPLKEALLVPPFPVRAFAGLEAIEAALEAALGKASTRLDEGTFWVLPEGGKLFVSGRGMTVIASDPPVGRPMSPAGWKRIMGVLADHIR